ncbi:MAG: ATP-binding cassette domain-containing protein, partial [Tannerellaceae bacterium]|nr:ATP-binding cassette domain-containing protein [Tannerellaceae bacterium]
LLFDKLISKLSTYKFPIRLKTNPDKQSSRPQVDNIKITGMDFGYGASLLFKKYTYTFEKGKIYGISSPSGSGKTTLLQLINGTLTPLAGNIQADRTQGIASVFQHPQLLSQLTVAENCILPLAGYITPSQAMQTVTRILEQMELKDYLNAFPGELSYGQQQRVSIARALAYPSPYLLMDEPFKGLDEELKKRIISYVRLHQRDTQQTVIFTSHSPEELELLADEIILSLQP